MARLRDRLFLGEIKSLNGNTREKLPGSFIQLNNGYTHYEIAGPDDEPPVVLVHGFSVPYFVWDPTFEALTAAGLRVLRYDLYGRGYSDRPHETNDLDFFTSQLFALLDALGLEDPVHVVSLSMGGVVAAEFVRRYPERVAGLAFIDPAGFDLGLPTAVKLLKLPLLGEFLLGLLDLFGRGSLMQAMLSDFYQPTQAAIDYFVPRYQGQMQYAGFKRSLLSSLRAGMFDEDLDLFRGVAASQKPVLLIWGEQDQTVPFRHAARFCELVPQVEFHAIGQAGHIPHFERPELVNPILIKFLKR